MSEIMEKRLLFAALFPKLLEYCHEIQVPVTIGEVMRDPRAAKLNAVNGVGIFESLHLVGLAVDLNLFRPDKSLVQDDFGHGRLGAYWKALHADCAWGGDFRSKDYNHYSVRYQGRR